MTTDPKQPEAQEAPASEREAFAELVAADAAHQQWCDWKRANPTPKDPTASYSSLGLSVKDDPEREAIIARLNAAWANARAALGKQPTQEASASAKRTEFDRLMVLVPSVSDFPAAIEQLEAQCMPIVHRLQNEPANLTDSLKAADWMQYALTVFRWVSAARSAQEAPADAKDAAPSEASLLEGLAKNHRWQLDNDIQKFGEPGKWRVWTLIGSQRYSTKTKTLGEGDTPAEALRAALQSNQEAK